MDPAGDSVWKDIQATMKEKPPVSLRFQQIEELFCLKPPTTPATPNDKKGTGSGQSQKEAAINLLDSKKSLAINIFLKQFKCPMDEIVDRIRRCDTQLLSAEHLRCLQKILPEPDEVSRHSTEKSLFFKFNFPFAGGHVEELQRRCGQTWSSGAVYSAIGGSFRVFAPHPSHHHQERFPSVHGRNRATPSAHSGHLSRPHIQQVFAGLYGRRPPVGQLSQFRKLLHNFEMIYNV